MADVKPLIHSRADSSPQILPSPSISNFVPEPRSTSRRDKRLTLNFPILLPRNGSDAARPMASPPIATPAETSPHLQPAAPSPVDPSGFLTSLAAQERKVLELKEELQRAEAELGSLKRQWAQYEAHKKKSEINHLEKLRPLQSSFKELPQALSRDISGRPKAKHDSRRTQQRVFSSSKHTRTLSLLSPTSTACEYSGTQSVEDVLSPLSIDSERDSDVTSTSAAEIPHGPTEPLARIKRPSEATRKSLPPPSRDAIVQSSKQMASDLRDGLWTFFEDMRQATVGDEGINATKSRTSIPNKKEPAPITNSNRGSSSTARNLLKSGSPAVTRALKADNTENSFWREFGLDTPGKRDETGDQMKPGPTETVVTAGSLLDEDDAWDSWDTPLAPRLPQSNESKLGSDNLSPNSNKSLPWPEIKSFTPSKLTKTVSELMKDWDISSPRPEPDLLQVSGRERTTDDDLKDR
ncbi:MAG: hypothetical protein Q9227_009559 [Pyrenula ochraceoflavens]